MNQVGVIARTNKRNGPRPHGSRAKYVVEKCRCEACRTANAEAQRLRTRLKAYGRYNCFVDAEASRKQINFLMLSGMRIKGDISRLTGISWTTLWKIRTKQRTKVTPETERRLMELDPLVTERCGNYVPADEVWETVYRIMECGYSRAFIARKLGYRARALQIGKEKVRRETAERISELYRWALDNPAPVSPESSRSKNAAKRLLINASRKLEERLKRLEGR